MKRTVTAVAVLAAVLLAGKAEAIDVTITNWIPNYQYIASTNSNVGTTGIETNTAYVCFPLTDISLATNDAAEASGDIRELIYRLVEYWHGQFEAAASTNRPTKLLISESGTYVGGTNSQLTIGHVFQSALGLPGMNVLDE